MPVTPNLDSQSWSQAVRSLGAATPAAEGQPVRQRADRWGVNPPSPLNADQQGVDETGYVVLTNPTLGTGVAYALQTSFSDTAALFAFQNTYKPNDPRARRFSPKRIKLILTAAPTATISLHCAVKIDDFTKDRTPTANTRNDMMVSPNMDDGFASQIRCYQFAAGSLTVPASSNNARTVSRGSIATGLGIVGDSYTFQFGGGDVPTRSPLTAVRATDVADFATIINPFSIGPGQWAVFYLWWLTAATAAPSFEYDISGNER